MTIPSVRRWATATTVGVPGCVEAMVATRNCFCGLGDGVRMSAHDSSVAEAQSDVSGHGEPAPNAPQATRPDSGRLATVVGRNRRQRPGGWGWVAPSSG